MSEPLPPPPVSEVRVVTCPDCHGTRIGAFFATCTTCSGTGVLARSAYAQESGIDCASDEDLRISDLEAETTDLAATAAELRACLKESERRAEVMERALRLISERAPFVPASDVVALAAKTIDEVNRIDTEAGTQGAT